jgi:chaperonin cofactor prefoldin
VKQLHIDVLRFEEKTNARLDRLEGKVDRLEGKVDRLETFVVSLDRKVDALPRVLAEMLDERVKRR